MSDQLACVKIITTVLSKIPLAIYASCFRTLSFAFPQKPYECSLPYTVSKSLIDYPHSLSFKVMWRSIHHCDQ